MPRLAPFALALFVALPAAGAPRSLAVLPLFGDVPAEEKQLLDGQLRTEAAALEKYALQEREVTTSELDTAKALGLDCAPVDATCLGKLAITLRVDRLVVPVALSTGPDSSALELAVFDAATASRINVARGDVPPPGPERAVEVRRLVRLLLTPESMLGRLVVAVDHLKAEVSLDGDEPLVGARVEFPAVPIGPHTVHVTAPGRAAVTETVDVKGDELTRLDIGLPPARAKGETGDGADGDGAPTGGMSPLVLAGAGIAGGGALLLVGASVTAGVMTALLEDGAFGGPDDRPVLWRVGQASLGVAALGAVAGVAGGALLGVGLSE